MDYPLKMGRRSFMDTDQRQEPTGKILNRHYYGNSLEEALLSDKTFMELFGLSGLAFVKENKELIIEGKFTGEEEVLEILKWINTTYLDEVFYTNSMSENFEKGFKWVDCASGVLLFVLPDDQFINGFRPDVVNTIDWGGNPNKAINFEPDGKTYHLRNLFDIWKEEVKGTSLPWSLLG